MLPPNGSQGSWQTRGQRKEARPTDSGAQGAHACSEPFLAPRPGLRGKRLAFRFCSRDGSYRFVRGPRSWSRTPRRFLAPRHREDAAASGAQTDEFRYAIERMTPVAYAQASYYERWVIAIERLLTDKGVLP